MPIFRKKPVEIEAIQWFKAGDHAAVVRLPKEHPLWRYGPDGQLTDQGYGYVHTLEGGHVVTPGDWIITGVQGENYPCKPDIFAATYDAV